MKDDIPGWLRDRIESLEIPVDRDLHFREVIAALVGLGWDASRIVIEIAGRPWIPTRYSASRALEWGVKPVVIAALEARADFRSKAALDYLPAVQRAVASGRWRESVQAKQWAGHAVAAVMKLDAEADKAKIVALLNTWNRRARSRRWRRRTAQKAPFRRSRIGGRVINYPARRRFRRFSER